MNGKNKKLIKHFSRSFAAVKNNGFLNQTEQTSSRIISTTQPTPISIQCHHQCHRKCRLGIHIMVCTKIIHLIQFSIINNIVINTRWIIKTWVKLIITYLRPQSKKTKNELTIKKIGQLLQRKIKNEDDKSTFLIKCGTNFDNIKCMKMLN